MELTEEVKVLVLNTAKDLKGSARRMFMARTVQALGAGGQRIVDGAALAQLAVQQASAPEPSAIVGQSARNRFTGIVTRVVKDKVAAQVEIQAGPHRVVSLMTREAADELGLEPGTLAVAAVKATNVVIAVPGE